MEIFFVCILLCTLLGSVTGAVTGWQYGVGWILGGALLGLAIGIASVFIFTIPYVYAQIRMERRGLPQWWGNLYLLVVVLCALLAGVGSWRVVHVLAGAAAG